MSYNIDFRVRVSDTDKYVSVGNCDANTTWNVRKIIELSTGLPWLNEKNNGFCIDVIPQIQRGYHELCCHPEKYKPYEAENKWGTIEGTKRFFLQILNDWNDFARSEDPDIVSRTTFWIV